MASSMTAAAMSVHLSPREVCQFFLSNSCRYGDRCFYSHDRSNGQSNNVCRYYLWGKCMYGDRCRYDHAQPRPQLLFPSIGTTMGSFPQDFLHDKPQFLNERDNEGNVLTGGRANDYSEPRPSDGDTTNLNPCVLLKINRVPVKPALCLCTETIGMIVLHFYKRAKIRQCPRILSLSMFHSFIDHCRTINIDERCRAYAFSLESINYANFCYQPSSVNEEQKGDSSSFTLQTLCPYAGQNGLCEALQTGRSCPYLHGDVCDLCHLRVLDSNDEQQREHHRLECLKKRETNCAEAFATQRSQDKKCGICLETVWNRDGDKRFGLLENCDHIFCLECIRKWRSSSNYEHKVVKACPECRTKSDFVTPTKYWPENDQAKNESIQAYKENLQKIHCKFFKRGDGTCPFGSKCFYLHVDKRGKYVQLPPPRRRRRMNTHGELENLSDILMISLLSTMDVGRFFDELDYLFNDDDDDEDDEEDDLESYGSHLTDDDEFRLANVPDLTDNDEEFRSWH